MVVDNTPRWKPAVNSVKRIINPGCSAYLRGLLLLIATIFVPYLAYFLYYYIFRSHSTQITDVTVVDDDRTDEIHDAASRIIADHGLTDVLRTDEIDWKYVSDQQRNLSDADQVTLGALRQRLERTYPTLVELTIDPGERIDFAPGQFLDFRHNGTRRAYSIASSPNDNQIELCIRRVPGGRLTDELLSDVQEGDKVTTWDPRGDFVLDENSEKDLVFLATGTGVAPFRSMIRYLYQEDLAKDQNVWLFLGTRWRDDLPYHEEFKRFERQHDGFHYVPTLSRESIVSNWEGETDYVQEVFLKYLIDGINPNNNSFIPDTFVGDFVNDLNPCSLSTRSRAFLDKEPRTGAPASIDPKNVQVYICGVDAAVSTFKSVATGVGVPRADVYSEGYG